MTQTKLSPDQVYQNSYVGCVDAGEDENGQSYYLDHHQKGGKDKWCVCKHENVIRWFPTLSEAKDYFYDMIGYQP